MSHSTNRATALLAALSLSACVSATKAPDTSIEAITLSPGTQSELSVYLARVKSTRPGAFAVSPDGRTSFYTWCDDISCMAWSYSNAALIDCWSLAGVPCVLLYVRDEPQAAYTRAATENGAPDGRHGSREQLPIDFDNRASLDHALSAPELVVQSQALRP